MPIRICGWNFAILFIADFFDCTFASSSTSALFSFTKSAYTVTIRENVRGRVYAETEDPSMGVHLPFHFNRNSSNKENLVRFKIISGDKQNFFKAESYPIGNFAFLRISTRHSLDLSINRELTPKFDLLVKGILKKANERSILEAVARVTVKILDENDLSPLFSSLPEELEIGPETALHSTLLQVTADDPDEGLNGEVYYSLRNEDSHFAINPYTGAVSLVKPFRVSELSYDAPTNVLLEILAEDRASRLLAHHQPASVDTVPRAGSLAKIRVEIRPLEKPETNIFIRSEISFDECGQNTRDLCALLELRSRQFSLLTDYFLSIAPNPYDTNFELEYHYRNSSVAIYYQLYSVGSLVSGKYDLPIAISRGDFFTDLAYPLKFVHNVSVVVNDPCTTVDSVLAKNMTKMLTVDECSLGGSSLDFVDSDLFSKSKNERVWRFLTPTDQFELDETWGLLMLKADAALDVHQARTYNLSIETFDKRCSDRVGSHDSLIPRIVYTVIITVVDCNNNAPIFHQSSCPIVFVNEATDLGEVLCEFKASDDDIGDNGLLYYSIRTTDKNISELFKIHPFTGRLYLRNPVYDDFWGKTLLFNIAATDHGSPFSLSAQCTVEVFFGTHIPTAGPIPKELRITPSLRRSPIVDYPPNLHAPTFVHPPTDDDVIQLHKPQFLGRPLYRFAAHDADSGPSGHLRFGLVGGDDDSRLDWRVDLWTGHLVPIRLPSQKNQYNLTVMIRDCARPAPQKYSLRNFSVLLIDGNDNAPSFDRSLYYFEVEEQCEPGRFVGRVRANDPDSGANGTVRYKLRESTDLFIVEPETGILRVGNFGPILFDREITDSYELRIVAHDGGAPALYSTPVVVIISLLDINDNAPRILDPHRRIRVPEDLPFNTIITCLEAYDPDLGNNGTVEYRFSGRTDDKFEIDSSSGCIRLKKNLDYDEAQVHNLTAEAIDFGHPRLSSLCNVVVEVINVRVNHLAPKFSKFAYEASVFENEPEGTFVTDVLAVDPENTSAVFAIIYSIVGGSGRGLFTINSNGRIRTLHRLDRETTSFYWLIVASRGYDATSRVLVYVEVLDRNDNRPEPLLPFFSAFVRENSPVDTPIVRLEAKDADADVQATAPNSHLAFKISQGDPQSFFKIDPKTGFISTDRRQIDRESVQNFELEITVSDEGVPPLTSKIPVFIGVEDENDNAPKFVDRFNEFQILASPNGRSSVFLCRVFAKDDDSSDFAKLSYSIVQGSEDGRLSVASNTGELYGLRLRVGETIALTMAVSDGKEKDLTNVVFNILPPPNHRNNAPPKLAKSNMTIHIASEERIGRSIGLIEAMDPNNDMLWFYLADGDSTFSVKPDTGEVQLAGPLKLPAYFLTYIVTDGLLNVSGKIHIAVQTLAEPHVRFLKDRYEVKVPENASLGTVIFKLQPEVTPKDENLRFFIWNAFSIDAEKKFEVEPRKGHVVLIDYVDHEITKFYTLHLEARGRKNRSFSLLTVAVQDINDHKPKFLETDLEIKLSEGSQPGKVIAELMAIDRDSGDAGKVSYKILGGNDFKFFDLDEETGLLKLAKPLHHSQPEFVLFVKAQDYGNPALSDFATLRIFVTSYDNGKVEFRQRSYVFRVPENQPIGSLVGKISVYTPSLHRFTLNEDGKTTNVLNIHPMDGTISLASSLDFESSRRHSVTVNCVDSRSGAEDSATILIEVLDVNDRRPKFVDNFYVGEVTENSTARLILASDGRPLAAKAVDDDTGRRGAVVYEICDNGKTIGMLFEIDYWTGSLRTKKSLDFEQEHSYEFLICAHDLGDPPLYAILPATVRVVVRNINDNPPSFDQSEYNATLYLPSFDQSAIVRLSAHDPDWSISDTASPVSFIPILHFCLINYKELFWIDLHTGSIYARDVGALSAGRRYSLNASVGDGYYKTYTKVNVLIENFENPPDFGFTKSSFETEVEENTDSSILLLHLSSYGLENHQNLHYELLNGSEWDENFKLHSKTGELYFSGRSIDREAILDRSGCIYLIAVLTDKYSNPPMVARSMVKVRVLDQNDNSPRFTLSSEQLLIRLTPRATVANHTEPLLTLRATDPDLGSNGTVGFRLVNTAKEVVSQTRFFSLNESTGCLRLAKDLDGEFSGGDEFELIIEAFDYGSRQLTSPTKVKVEIVRGTSLYFDKAYFDFSIAENSPVETQVAMLKPSSAEQFNLVGYSLIDGDINSLFRLDFKSGRLTTQKSIDYENQPNLTLIIRAQNFVTRDWQDAMVRINIEDVIDKAPLFQHSFYKFFITENAHSNSFVGRVIAEYPVSFRNRTIRYWIDKSIVDNSMSLPFRIDQISGTLHCVDNPKLDFEFQSKYVFDVVAEVTDAPLLKSRVTVFVVILDMNDNAPKFTRLAYEASVWKNVEPGSFVTQVFAHDLDAMDRDKLFFDIGIEPANYGNDESRHAFSINKRSGVIRTLGSLTNSSKSLHSLNVTVTDGFYVSFALLNIRTLEHKAFYSNNTKGLFEFKVWENINLHIAVGQIDPNPMMRFKYKLLNFEDQFRVDESSGQIYVINRKLDAELRDFFLLSILARSLSHDDQSTYPVQVRIVVLNVNDNAPTFPATEIFLTLPHDYLANKTILRAFADDADKNDRVEYSLRKKDSSNHVANFLKLNSSSGNLRCTGDWSLLVGRRLNFVIVATDQGNPPLHDELAVQIKIAKSSHLSSFSFPKSEYRFVVSENAGVGQSVGQLLSANDLIGQNIKFGILPNRQSRELQSNSIFDLDSSGSINLAENLDREKTSSYNFYVVATKYSEHVSIALVHIKVQDENDNAPQFCDNTLKPIRVNLSISEDTKIGTNIIWLWAEDADRGQKSSVKYEIEPPKPGFQFAIHAQSGWITVAEGLDRETEDIIEFSVTTRDQQSEIKGQHITIAVNLLDVNDQPPKFVYQFYEFSVSENVALGTVVGQVTVADSDLWPNNRTSLFIIDGNSKNLFGIHENGVVYALGQLDYETDSKHNLTILATDGKFSTTVQCAIRIIDEPETSSTCNTSIIQFEVYENATVGSKLFNIRQLYSDVDIQNGWKPNFVLDPSSYFKLTDDGFILLNDKLDREKLQRIWLILKSKQMDINYCEMKAVINVLDVNDETPMFDNVRNEYAIELQENSPGPYPLFLTQLFALDKDLGNNSKISFALADNVDRSKFVVHESSGSIFALKPFDREEFDFYEIRVIASDQGTVQSLNATTVVRLTVLDVKDNPPIFDQDLYPVKILENLTVGTTVLSVKARTKDASYNDKNIRYEINSEDLTLLNDRFSLDPETGFIVLKNPLDRETVSEYKLHVTAYDNENAELRSFCRVVIEILDVNDNAPLFEQSFYRIRIPEDEKPGATVGRVHATDRDKSHNARISYSLEGYDISDDSTAADLVLKVTSDGSLVLIETLDFEKKKAYEISLKATDSGEPPLFSTVKLYIDVIDINDNAPVIKNCNKTINVRSTLTKNAEILTIKVSDADGIGNGEPFLFDIFGKKSDDFAILSSGIVTLAQSTFSQTAYDLKVVAKDSGSPPLSSNACHLYIRIVEQSRYPPEIQAFRTTIVAYYGEYQGGVVGRILASDRDANDRLTFSVDVLAATSVVNGRRRRAMSKKTARHRKLSSLINRNGFDGDFADVEAAEDVAVAHVTSSKTSTGRNAAEKRMLLHADDDEFASSKEEAFAVHADDGWVTAVAGLPLGLHRINVSVTDGTFTSSAVSVIEVRAITNEMLSASLSLEIPGLVSHAFVQLHMKHFVRSISSALGVRPQFVHVLSLQDEESPADPSDDNSSNVVQILFAVKKSRTEWLKSEQVRERLVLKWREEIAVASRIQKSVATEASDPESAASSSSALTPLDDSKVGSSSDQSNDSNDDGDSSLDDLSSVALPLIGLKYDAGDTIEPRLAPWLSANVRLIAETCRRDSCGSHGDCRDALTLDDGRQTVALGGETGNFISPRHKRAPECICYDGYAGPSCKMNVSHCSSMPCAANRICIPDELPSSYFCSCLPGKSGSNCLSDFCSNNDSFCSDSVTNFNGRSFVRHTLWKSLAIEMELKLEFKTSSPFGTISFCSGNTDFETLEILGSTLRYRVDFGSGENMLVVKQIAVSDDRWHLVKVVRRQKHVILQLDGKKRVELHAVGASNVLNLHSDHIYFGAQMPSGLGDEDETRYQSLPARLKNTPFVGCLRSVELNGYRLSPVGPGVSLRGVRFNCEPFGSHADRCPDGSSGPQCLRIRESANDPIRHGVVCPAGYTGPSCNENVRTMNDLQNPCLNEPCLNQGVCIKVSIREFVCNCTQGWTGPTCSLAYPLQPNAANSGFYFYSYWPQMVGVAALFFALVLLSVCIVLACKRRTRFRYTKANYIQNVANDEITCDMMQPQSLSYNRRHRKGDGSSAGGSATPIRPRLVSPYLDDQDKPPPPLPPRLRSFGGQHQNLLLSNLESAKSTGIPTVQVRPLSMIDCQSQGAASPLPPSSVFCADSAADYGSAAEDLERLGIADSLDRSGNGDAGDWKAALQNVEFTEDSLERLKAAALSLGSPSKRNSRRKTTDSFAAQSASSIQCLPEDEQTRTYQWDYSDWNSTLAPPPKPLPRDYDTMDRSELSSLLHMDNALYSNGSLPGGVSRFEETDVECDFADDDYMSSNAVRPIDDEDGVTASLNALEDATKGVDQFRLQLMALSNLKKNAPCAKNSQDVAPPSRTLPARISKSTTSPTSREASDKQSQVKKAALGDASSGNVQRGSD